MSADLHIPTAYGLLDLLGTVSTETSLSLEEFTRFCERYPDLIAEREASGKVIVMSPVKSGSGENEGHVFGYVYAWNLMNGKPGKAYSPSTGFLLAGEEVRCGDSVWISNGALATFLADPNNKDKWVEAVPEFVVEVRSGSDGLKKLKLKMTDTWLANGVKLAWLIDTYKEVAYIYRQGHAEVEEIRDFETSVLSGEDVLPGFEFPLVELNV